MDVQHFKAPFLRRIDIWRQADELRQCLLAEAALPGPVPPHKAVQEVIRTYR